MSSNVRIFAINRTEFIRRVSQRFVAVDPSIFSIESEKFTSIEIIGIGKNSFDPEPSKISFGWIECRCKWNSCSRCYKRWPWPQHVGSKMRLPWLCNGDNRRRWRNNAYVTQPIMQNATYVHVHRSGASSILLASRVSAWRLRFLTSLNDNARPNMPRDYDHCYVKPAQQGNGIAFVN